EPLHAAASQTSLAALLLLALAMFVAMSATDRVLDAFWLALRGQPVQEPLRRFVKRVLPLEALAAPLGALLAFALDSRAPRMAFALVAITGLYVSRLLADLGESSERLRRSGREL